MKFVSLLLLILAVACQQPTSISFAEQDMQFLENVAADQFYANALSVTGIVIWTSPPGHFGKITTSDGSVFTYNVNAGHTVDGYAPVVGDAVQFNTGFGASARLVRPFDIPNEDDDSDNDNDDDNGNDDVTPPRTTL